MVRSGRSFVLMALIYGTIVFFAILVANVASVVVDRWEKNRATVEFSQSELDDWMSGTVAYNVDVRITSGHAWQEHGADQVTAALRCVNENGTKFVISENFNRHLHLLCEDKEGNQFVVIITKIRKAVDAFRNATAELVTAFKLEHGATLGSYIQNEVITYSKGIVVRLNFKAGEIFFLPH